MTTLFRRNKRFLEIVHLYLKPMAYIHFFFFLCWTIYLLVKCSLAFQIREIKALYLYHALPTWYQFVTSTFCHANWLVYLAILDSFNFPSLLGRLFFPWTSRRAAYLYINREELLGRLVVLCSVLWIYEVYHDCPIYYNAVLLPLFLGYLIKSFLIIYRNHLSSNLFFVYIFGESWFRKKMHCLLLLVQLRTPSADLNIQESLWRRRKVTLLCGCLTFWLVPGQTWFRGWFSRHPLCHLEHLVLFLAFSPLVF